MTPMTPMMKMPLKTRRAVSQRMVAKSRQKPVPGVVADDVAAVGDATVAAAKIHPPQTLTTLPTPTHHTHTKMTSARFSSKRIMKTW